MVSSAKKVKKRPMMIKAVVFPAELVYGLQLLSGELDMADHWRKS